MSTRFRQYEESLEGGKPISLFRFQYGTGNEDYYCYTDAEIDTWYEGLLYKAVPISRDAIRTTGTLDKTSLRVQLPNRTELGDLFRSRPPSYTVRLDILDGHETRRTDEGEQLNPFPGGTTIPVDFAQFWSGRVISFGIRENDLELTCEPISTALARPGLRANYQRGCRHVLYGPRCRAPKIARNTTVTAIGRENVININPGAFSDGMARFVNGSAEWTDANGHKAIYSIWAVSAGGAIRLNATPIGVTVGQPIQIFPGCDRTRTGCQLHNNIVNFGGFPWIPLKNPASSGSPFR